MRLSIKEEPHEYWGSLTAVKFLITNTSGTTIDGLTVPLGLFHLKFLPGGTSIPGRTSDADVVQLLNLKPKVSQEFEVAFALKWDQFQAATANRNFNCYAVGIDALADIQNARWERPLNHGLSTPPAC
jgi:hypothetical protein